VAESGEQALEQLETITPDAIFVDYFMDGMDGLETIAAIKKIPRLTNIPVVMCTANEGKRYAEAAESHGAVGIMTKPPTREGLQEIIELVDQAGVDCHLAAGHAPGIDHLGVIDDHHLPFPVAGIGIILAVDWFLDRCRTAVNVWGDAVGAAVLSRSVGRI